MQLWKYLIKIRTDWVFWFFFNLPSKKINVENLNMKNVFPRDVL